MSAAYYVCTTKVDFPATEAPGVPGVLHVCTTKSRLSSHGSSACPRRTTFVLQKSIFQPWKLRVSPAYYTCVLQKSTFQPRKLSVSVAYYVCTTKSRPSSHGGSACPRRSTFVLQKSIFQPRKSPAYYVCTTQVDKKNAKTLRFSHREHAKTRRGVTFACQETQKHDGFGTAPTPKPAEGLRLYVTKRKNTTVLAPRQRRNPQRGYVCMPQNARTRRFWHRANAETRRGLFAATEKSTKNDGFSIATRRLPAEGCPRT